MIIYPSRDKPVKLALKNDLLQKKKIIITIHNDRLDMYY